MHYLLILLLLVTSCKPVLDTIPIDPDPVVIDQYEAIYKTSETITLEWDGESDVYNVYYRIHGQEIWEILLESTSSFIEINKELLGKGEFDFGVSIGYDQEIHSSLDIDAIPEGGWYLIWE